MVSICGFTLIEVLVVVAITALLVAILLPSLAAARAEVRRVTCESNLKQIHVGWSTFLDQVNGWFPAASANLQYNYGGRQGEGSTAFAVPKLINPQMKLPTVTRTGAEVFRCPSEKATVFMPAPPFAAYYGTSYVMNHLLIGRKIQAVSSNPCKAVWAKMADNTAVIPTKRGLIYKLRRDDINDPAMVMFNGDYTWREHWDYTLPAEFPYWHRRRFAHNFSFLDGHGEFIQIRKGVHVAGRFTIVPFRNLREECVTYQQEVLPP